MYYNTLEKIREYIRFNRYVMTIHAEEEMSDDNLTIFYVEHVIFTGKIIERQRDNISLEWKYIIEGNTLDKSIATVVTKISITKKVVIITIFMGSSYDM